MVYYHQFRLLVIKIIGQTYNINKSGKLSVMHISKFVSSLSYNACWATTHFNRFVELSSLPLHFGSLSISANLN